MTDLQAFGRTGEEVVAETMMELAVRTAVLIVEGRTDHLALEEHLAGAVAVVIADNKHNALQAARLLDQHGVGPEVSVLVDRDHDGDRGVGGRVIVTAARDLDAELLECGEALRRLCKSRHATRKGPSLQEVRSQIAELAVPASALLTAVQRGGLSVKATGLNLKSIRDIPEPAGKIDALARQALSKSPHAGIQVGQLSEMAMIEFAASDMRLDTCQGHYLHAAVVIVVPGDQRPEKVQASVWVTVRSAEFRQSPTGRALAEWGQLISVEVFKAERSAA